MSRFTTLVVALLLALPASPLLGQAGTSPGRRGVVPLERRGLCGDGMFQFKIGGSAIGQETFQVNCLPGGGYAAGGRTELALPSATTSVVKRDMTLRRGWDVGGTWVGRWWRTVCWLPL